MFTLFLVSTFVMFSKVLLAKTGQSDMVVDRLYGIGGCRELCEERRACLDFRYSPVTLLCTLRFDSLKPCSTREPNTLCTYRSIRTRSGRKVDVLEKYHGHHTAGTPGKYKEIKLTFTQVKRMCKGGKKLGNIIQAKPAATGQDRCTAFSDPKLRSSVNYTWAMRPVDLQMNSQVKLQTQLTFKTTNHPGRVLFKFDFGMNNGTFAFKPQRVDDLEYFNITQQPSMKFFITKRTLKIIDGGNNIFFPEKNCYKDIGSRKYRLYVKTWGMKLIFE